MPACTTDRTTPPASTRSSSTATACSTCRTADHRADLAAAVRQGSPVGDERARERDRRRLDGRRRSINLQSGFPIGLAERQHAVRRGQPAEPHRRRLRDTGRLRGPARVGGSPDRDLDQPGGHSRRRRRARSATRRGSITDVRTPPIKNTDLSFSKNIGLSGSKSAQIKVEIINLFNRVQTQQHQRDRRQLGVRPDHVAVRVHAADAGDVPLHLLDRRRSTQQTARTRRATQFYYGFHSPGVRFSLCRFLCGFRVLRSRSR